MVRSVGIAAVVLGLAWTGLVGAQSSSPLEKARYLMVSEEGKPPQRCKLLKTWREANGAPAFQVQAVDSGEFMTIVGTAPQGLGSNSREMTTRIFRWGRGNKPPAGVPMPPPNATVLDAPPAAPKPSTPTSATAQKTPPAVPTQGLETRTTAVATQSVATKAATPAAVKFQPAPAAQTVRKPNPAPVPPPTQPVSSSYVLANNKPTSSAAAVKPISVAPSKSPQLTPMSTQVVQYLPDSKQEKRSEGQGASGVKEAPSSLAPQPLPLASQGQPRLTPLPAGSVVSQKSCSCPCPPPCGAGCQSCNPCCQSSCVCGTPSPMRQPIIRRLLKSNSPCNCTTTVCQPASSGPTQKAETSVGKAAPPAPSVPTQNVATRTVEPAKPGDWRQSWGNVEPWKGPVQASNVKPIEVSKRVSPTPVRMEPSAQPDPLKAPDQYRDIVMNARLANSKIPQENRPSAMAQLKEKLAERKRPVGPMPPAMPGGAPTPPNQPPSRMIMIAADEPNAFWSPQQPGAGQTKTPNNAFDREPPPPPQGVPPASAGILPNGPTSAPPMLPGIMQGPPPQGLVLKNAPQPPRAPYTPPPGPASPMAPDTGVPDAMANAFTLSGTRRPIPADFGGTPQEPNGFDPPVQMDGTPPRAYGQAMPGMYRPSLPPGVPMQNMTTSAATPRIVNPLMSVPATPPHGQYAAAAAAPAAPAGVPQLLAALKDSLRPSEREAAAERLSELDWRVQPLVVEQLMKAAREDPAATVRAACVHALAQMKITTPGALALVRDLKSDRDPRVRQEAEEALSALGDSGIQQASHK
jgi:hypothetical protein